MDALDSEFAGAKTPHGWTPPSGLERAGLPLLQKGWKPPGSQLSRVASGAGELVVAAKETYDDAVALEQEELTSALAWTGNPPRMALAFRIRHPGAASMAF